MTGPPTPPITSAIEIEDAARAAAAPAPQAPGANVVTGETAPAAPGEPVAAQVAIAATTEQASSPYRHAFATIVQLASSGNFEELVEVAEQADLTTTQDNSLERFLVVTPLVIAYFILDNISPAVHAITRLPDILKAHPISRVSFGLAASISERKYGNVYPRASELLLAVQNTQIPDADFQAIIGDLLTKFIDTFRQRTLVLLSKAYTSIPLALAQSYLNCLPEEALVVANQNRWGYDPNTKVLTPVLSKAGTYSASGSLAGISSLATFDIIANTNLE